MLKTWQLSGLDSKRVKTLFLNRLRCYGLGLHFFIRQTVLLPCPICTGTRFLYHVNSWALNMR